MCAIFPECVTVSAREGEYQFRAGADAGGGETCGFFIVGDADQVVKVEMTEIDVSCGDGGLVVVSRKRLGRTLSWESLWEQMGIGQ